jgi:ribonucleotide reductase beta subunit family protein with ferritin-like domain
MIIPTPIPYNDVGGLNISLQVEKSSVSATSYTTTIANHYTNKDTVICIKDQSDCTHSDTVVKHTSNHIMYHTIAANNIEHLNFYGGNYVFINAGKQTCDASAGSSTDFVVP